MKEGKEEGKVEAETICHRIMMKNQPLEYKLKMLNTFAGGFYLNGQLKEAETLLLAALEIDNASDITLRNMAMVQLDLGYEEKAEKIVAEMSVPDFMLLNLGRYREASVELNGDKIMKDNNSIYEILNKTKKQFIYRGGKNIIGGLLWDVLTEKRLNDPRGLERYGYKVYSQNDEDGIIQEIFRRIGTTNKRFIEFGVQNGLESNGHYLLHLGWNGLWIESDDYAVKEICRIFHKPIKTSQLSLRRAFITRDNIDRIIEMENFSGDLDLLSIDIDGNDYYIWEKISVVRPRVVVIEYNGKFPPDYSWKMGYNEKYVWDGSDKHGASLKALQELGEKLGYHLVGTNLRGVNAFFVKAELTKDLFYSPATAEALYNPLREDYAFLSYHPAKDYLGQ